MKYCFITFLLLILAGCSTQRSVICFSPRKPFEPDSGKELFEAFNAAVPFDISPRDFMCKATSSGLVGWAVVSGERQKDEAKAALREATTLKLLQVESLTPEFAETIMTRWRQSQDVVPIGNSVLVDL